MDAIYRMFVTKYGTSYLEIVSDVEYPCKGEDTSTPDDNDTEPVQLPLWDD